MRLNGSVIDLFVIRLHVKYPFESLTADNMNVDVARDVNVNVTVTVAVVAAALVMCFKLVTAGRHITFKFSKFIVN